MKDRRYMRNQLTGVLAVLCGALAIGAQWLLGANSGFLAANTYAGAVDTHERYLTRTNDVAITARHLLWKEGSTPGTTAALCTAADIPIGTIDNTTTATGAVQKVELLGGNRTLPMVASEAMATVGVDVYAAAGGKIALLGVVKVGVLRTVAGANNDLVEVESCKPEVKPNGATTKAGAVLAVPITRRVVTMTTGGAESLTLADGLPGQSLTVILGTDGGDGTLTPTTKTGFTSITFADARDIAELEFVDATTGWVIKGLSGAAAPPAFT
ncbi:MAG: hypothetical protein ACO1TE_29165 [Prosthecobacter sp.]